jgi:hypothetical protein
MAAGSTYTPIATTTLGSSAGSYTFSSIPSTYTDLFLVGTYGSTSGSSDYLQMRFNGDTSTNYSATRLDGNGTSARSTRSSNQNIMWLDWDSAAENALTKMCRVNIMNYANTTTFKTCLIRGDRATSTDPTYTGTEAIAGLWRKTPEAITTILLQFGTGSIMAGSTFTLYGIAAA